MKISKEYLKQLLREVLEERSVAAEKTITEMIESLSKAIGVAIISLDNGDYCIDGKDPHYVRIRPITSEFFDVEYIKDKTDRKKFLYMPFTELKKTLKDLFSYDNKNYVDSARQRCIDNSKFNEKGGTPDAHTVNCGAGEKIKYAENMNKEKDNPDQPMRPVEDIKKQIYHEETKVKYTPPKLPKALTKLKPEYTKTGKLRKYTD